MKDLPPRVFQSFLFFVKDTCAYPHEHGNSSLLAHCGQEEQEERGGEEGENREAAAGGNHYQPGARVGPAHPQHLRVL